MKELTGGKFYTVQELCDLLGIKPNTVTGKLKRIAKKENKRIQIKTYMNNDAVCVKYRLANKPYTELHECCDPIHKSTITWSQINDYGARLSNTSYDNICILFELRNEYRNFSDLTDFGINNPTKALNSLEKQGFIIHRRNSKWNREVKLIGVKQKKTVTKSDLLPQTNMKLINEVFR